LNSNDRPPVGSERDGSPSDGAPVDGHLGGSRRGRSHGAILWSAANAWQRAIRWALEPLDLTHVQYMLLGHLSRPDWDGGAITQAMLSRRSGVDEMMTSQVLRTLESKGLIERHAHSTDSRAKVLALTARGSDVAREATGLAESAEREFFGPMGDAFLSTMTALEKVLPPSWSALS